MTEPEPGVTCPRGTSLVERVVGIGHSDIAEVTQRFCQRPDGVRHGPFVARRGTAVIEQGSYQDGHRQGPWRFADAAGHRTRSGSYDGGHQHGRWVSHHPEGGLAWRGQFVCGHRTGQFIWWTPDGTELQRRTF